MKRLAWRTNAQTFIITV